MWNTHGIGTASTDGLLGYQCRTGEFWTAPWIFAEEPEYTFTHVRAYSLYCVRPDITLAERELDQAIRLQKVVPDSAKSHFDNAFSIYRAAARQHWSWGMIGLAKMYYEGHPPVKKSLKSVEYWLLQAAWMGDKWALQDLVMFYQTDKKTKKQKEWVRKFAQESHDLIQRSGMSLREMRMYLYKHVMDCHSPIPFHEGSIQLAEVALDPGLQRSSQVL